MGSRRQKFAAAQANKKATVIYFKKKKRCQPIAYSANEKLYSLYARWSQKNIPPLHEARRKIISAFIFSALIVRSVIPARVGRKIASNPSRQCHGHKRLDRFIGNKKINREDIFQCYLWRLAKLLHTVEEVILAFDWTIVREKYNFLSVSMVTFNGRSIPIAFDMYKLRKLKAFQSQNKIEEEMLLRIISAIPKKKRVIFIADRGFDRPNLARMFKRNNVLFIQRVSINTWIKTRRRSFKLKRRSVKKGTQHDFGKVLYTRTLPVEVRLISAYDRNMKDPWYLITNIDNRTNVQNILNIYGSRMEIEEMFKSMKNETFGFHWKMVLIGSINRWMIFMLLVTMLFQFLAVLYYTLHEHADGIAAGYTLCRRNDRSVFSFIGLITMIIEDAVTFNACVLRV